MAPVPWIRARAFSIFGWAGRAPAGFRLLGLGGLLAGLLKLAEPAFGACGFAAEADGTAAETEDAGQRQIRRGGLRQGFEPLEAEADDVGGEAQFVLGFRVVGEKLWAAA